jgi:hypothetical protein
MFAVASAVCGKAARIRDFRPVPMPQKLHLFTRVEVLTLGNPDGL